MATMLHVERDRLETLRGDDFHRQRIRNSGPGRKHDLSGPQAFSQAHDIRSFA
jgi:hypothetical protein